MAGWAALRPPFREGAAHERSGGGRGHPPPSFFVTAPHLGIVDRLLSQRGPFDDGMLRMRAAEGGVVAWRGLCEMHAKWAARPIYVVQVGVCGVMLRLGRRPPWLPTACEMQYSLAFPLWLSFMQARMHCMSQPVSAIAKGGRVPTPAHACSACCKSMQIWERQGQEHSAGRGGLPCCCCGCPVYIVAGRGRPLHACVCRAPPPFNNRRCP